LGAANRHAVRATVRRVGHSEVGEDRLRADVLEEEGLLATVLAPKPGLPLLEREPVGPVVPREPRRLGSDPTPRYRPHRRDAISHVRGPASSPKALGAHAVRRPPVTSDTPEARILSPSGEERPRRGALARHPRTRAR